MKIQLLFSFLFVGFQSIVYGMEPQSPHSQADMYSGQSTPQSFLHAKCDKACKDPVHRVRTYSRSDDGFEHTIEAVCVVIKARPVENLTKEQRSAAVDAQHIKAMTPKGPCLKY